MTVTEPGTPGGSPWVGRSVRRLEDARALTGQTRYVADQRPAGVRHLAFVRSPFANAAISAIDTSAAEGAPGVTAVLTWRDLASEAPMLAGAFEPHQPLLADGAARYYGHPVAVVVADDRYRAEDTAELVDVSYEPLPAVTGAEAALDGEVLAHPDLATNVVHHVDSWPDEVTEALEAAPVMVEGDFTTQLQTAMPLETRGVVAEYEPAARYLTVHASTQMAHFLRDSLAELLDLPSSSVRVVAPDVGGGFGVKLAVYAEAVITSLLAIRLGQPMKWICDRVEAFGSDYQARGCHYRARAGFDSDGRWLAYGVHMIAPAGAYPAVPFSGAAVEPFIGSICLPGAYKIASFGSRTDGVLTNTPPTCPYRATGGPGATWVTESILDRAARALGIGRFEIRHRNIAQPEDLPFEGASGAMMDDCSFDEALTVTERELGMAELEADLARQRADGRIVGLGIANFVEPTTFGVAGEERSPTPPYDSATVRVEPSGGITLVLGASSQGQGHATTMAQVVADQLSVDPHDIRLVTGDTAFTPYGGGTHGSRVATIAGGAALLAGRAVADKARTVAAHLFEAAVHDIELVDGQAQVVGVPARGIALTEIAHIAHHVPQRLPAGLEPCLEETRRYTAPRPFTFTNGCHAAVVEIDPDTGAFVVCRYLVVQDCGVVINPMIVEGQIRGGVAQGVGSTFLEKVVYDEHGQLLTAGWGDYLMPAVTDMARQLEIVHIQTPSSHPGGMKGMGEAGLHASPAALAGAVADAIGADIGELPLTPARVLALLDDARDEAVQAPGG